MMDGIDYLNKNEIGANKKFFSYLLLLKVCEQ